MMGRERGKQRLSSPRERRVSLSEEERAVVGTVAEFVDREVRPVARDLEHANEYPEKLIAQMKALGIYGLAIGEPYGDAPVSTPCYAEVTAELARGWMSLAGAMGGHTVVAKLLLELRHRRAEAALPAEDGHRRDPRHDGPDRAGRRVRPAGDDDGRQAARRRVPDQRRQDLDHQRAPVAADRAAVQDRPGRVAPSPRHQHPAGGARARPGGVARPAQARVQGRGELRAVVRRLRRPRRRACSAESQGAASPR